MPSYKNSPHSYLYDAARQLRQAATLVQKAAEWMDDAGETVESRKIMDRALATMQAAETRIRSHSNYK